jgi:hypothetical protein
MYGGHASDVEFFIKELDDVRTGRTVRGHPLGEKQYRPGFEDDYTRFDPFQGVRPHLKKKKRSVGTSVSLPHQNRGSSSMAGVPSSAGSDSSCRSLSRAAMVLAS